MNKIARLRSESEKVIRIVEAYHDQIDPLYSTPPSEFQRRQELVKSAVAQAGCDVGVVFSDEC